MANHASAEKNIRQTKRRTLRNKSRVSEIRTTIRKFEEGKDPLDKVQSLMMRAIRRGIFHKNTVARKISRLAKRQVS